MAKSEIHLVGRAVGPDSLADALTRVRVQLEGGGVLAPGELVRVVGRFHNGVLTGARVLERFVGTATSKEFSRLRGGVARRLVQRAQAKRFIRDYFESQGFVEVDTPVAIPAPGTDPYIESFSAERGFLSPSPEFQMKRLIAGGLGRIYQLAPVLRAEELGPLHLPEFMLCEWYRAFDGYEVVQVDTESLVRGVVQALTGTTRVKARDGQLVECGESFERITVRDAFRRFAGIADAAALAADDEARYFQLLVDAVEPALARFARPVFLLEYPRSQAALARACPRDETVAERFELYLGGVELCNGYGELTDPVEQRARFEHDQIRRAKKGQRALPLDERFLAALSEGLPRTSGNALGLDRLVLVAAGAQTLGEVQAFPDEWL